MADKTITDLNPLVTPASNDVLAIVDVAGNETKKIEVGNLVSASGVTEVATGTGLTGGPITGTGTVSLADTSVTPGSYVGADITVDAQGRVTSASNGNRVVLNFGSASGMVAGQIYTLNGGTWTAVDASVGGEATTNGLLALSLGTNPVSDGMLVQGVGQLNHNPGTTGSILYIGTGTPGQLTATQPSATNEFSRVVGYKLGNSEMFLLPSQDYIKIA
mgnify:FL=1